ncbi:hypothetical protein NPIL_230831 [Nephila pilipes]|uniref:Uncharacterized protein n=1 Tax=Nephila pilipes TaxID=299642 RepID=A0A8X6PPV5_NEPPI|nr:hypothetical protein NPIL_230831 [Nephila pilipes]
MGMRVYLQGCGITTLRTAVVDILNKLADTADNVLTTDNAGEWLTVDEEESSQCPTYDDIIGEKLMGENEEGDDGERMTAVQTIPHNTFLLIH